MWLLQWYLPVSDKKNSRSYNVNPSSTIANTVFSYKKRKVADKFINIDYNEATFEKIMKEF